MTDGWVLVPREPTEAMVEAGARALDQSKLVVTFRSHHPWLGLSRSVVEASLAAAPPADGWQPIETAPRDGGDVLLWDGKRARFGSWRVDDGFASKKPMWLDDSHDDFSCGFASVPLNPTHWMPLPQPPDNERTG